MFVLFEYIKNVRLCGIIYIIYVVIYVVGNIYIGVVVEIYSCFYKKVIEINVIQFKYVVSIVVYFDVW